MGMSITSASRTSFIAASSGATQSPERRAFGQLTKALRTDALTGAQAAYQTMVANAPAPAGRNPDSAFAQLGSALQSGDLDAAKSDYVTMLESHTDWPPVETAKPIAVDSGSGGGVGSLLNLTA